MLHQGLLQGDSDMPQILTDVKKLAGECSLVGKVGFNFLVAVLDEHMGSCILNALITAKG